VTSIKKTFVNRLIKKVTENMPLNAAHDTWK